MYAAFENADYDFFKLYRKQFSQFNEGIVKRLFCDLLSGVEYLHSKNIIHRDLKPENILVNKFGRVKIADFGLAREFRKENEIMTKNICTIWYRCPELLYGSCNYSSEVDMWSLGCILAELLRGEPLFNGSGQINILCKITETLGPIDVRILIKYRKLHHLELLVVPHMCHLVVK